MLLTSCSSPKNYLGRINFQNKFKENFFDTEFKINKKIEPSKNPKQTIKLRSYEDFIEIVISLSTKNNNLKPAHYIEFSSNFFYEDVDFIKNKLSENNCELAIYTKLADINSVELSKDLKKIFYKKQNGDYFFICVFMCEIRAIDVV